MKSAEQAITDVVFITGASSGFGKAVSEYLALKGFKIYGTSRKPDLVKFSDHSNIMMLKMDVKDEVSIRQAIQYVIEKEGRIDVLLNNSGISTISPLEETPIQEIIDILDTNLIGALRVCQAVLPFMRERRSGLIINMSSLGGLIGLPFRGIYSASKFALEGLTESLSMEVKPFGINVCLIEPGDFRTNISRNRKKIELASDSVYKQSCEMIQKVADKQIEAASGPEAMGRLVHHIINSKKKRLRYKIGTFSEKSAVFLKIILPGRVFERIVMKIYRL